MPGGRHVALRVAWSQQTVELGATACLEAFVGHREETPAAIERIRLSSAASHRLVLRPPAAPVELELAGFVRWESSATLVASESISSRTARHALERSSVAYATVSRRAVPFLSSHAFGCFPLLPGTTSTSWSQVTSPNWVEKS